MTSALDVVRYLDEIARHSGVNLDQVAAIGGQKAAAREWAKFCDYWNAKSGKDAAKLDWQATWRNWLRNASERQGTTTVAGDPRAGPPADYDPSQAEARFAELTGGGAR